VPPMSTILPKAWPEPDLSGIEVTRAIVERLLTYLFYGISDRPQERRSPVKIGRKLPLEGISFSLPPIKIRGVFRNWRGRHINEL
jgi:hypothetical protein